MDGPRPKVYIDKCIKFMPETSRIGLDWGADDYGFNLLTVYQDDNCTVTQGTVKNVQKTSGDCFQKSDVGCANPDKYEGVDVFCGWKSVKATRVPN